jgi:hypothetical protein
MRAAARAWCRSFRVSIVGTYDVRSDLAAHDGVHSDHFCGSVVFDGP